MEHLTVLFGSPRAQLSWLDKLAVSLLLLAALYLLAKRCVWLFELGTQCIVHTSRYCFTAQYVTWRHTDEHLVLTGVWVCLLHL